MELKDAVLANRITHILKDAPDGSATRQLVEWFEREQKNGLISVSVTCVEGVHNPELLDDTELTDAIEERAAEFMRAINAPSVPHREKL
ncbi:MAG: hypothetical protein AAB447_03700 [Patescibacteria group bacterium]